MMRKRIYQWGRLSTAASAVLCILANTIQLGAATAFSVEGEAKEVFVADGHQKVTSEWRFRVQSEDCRWEMALAIGDGDDAKTSHILFDGVNLTTLSEGGGTNRTQRYEYTAGLFAGAVPQFGGNAAFIWLAFGSGCVLEEGPDVLRPVFQGYDAQDYIPIAYELNAKPPGLPEELSFVSSGAGHRTNAVYNVTEFTNYAGLLLPARFQATLYSSNNTAFVRYEGLVTNVTPSASVSSSLTLPALTLIQDHRLKASEFVSEGFEYVTNRWLSYDEARSIQPPVPTLSTPSTLRFLLLAAVAVLFGFSILLIKKINHVKEQL